MEEVTFEPDPRLAEIAESYAEDAVRHAAYTYGITLDFTDGSIELVEQILDNFHETIADAPDEDTVITFAKVWGSYLGETLRRNHGTIWGMVTLEGDTIPGMRSADESVFWPWGKAHNRIVNGPEDNVWDYYQLVIS